jgi:cysteinyl-tRNA synthetase, unknown class
MSRSHLAFLSAILLLAFAPTLAEAQQGGQVRTQGRDVTPEGQEEIDTGPRAAVLDYREEMRSFIQNISNFTRRYNPNFAVIPQNGLDLIVKVDPDNETTSVPARTYIRAIDGVLQEGMFYGYPLFGKPTEKERQERLLKLMAVAKSNRLKVLVMDFAKDTKTIDAAYRRNARKGFVPYVAFARGLDLNALPRYPKRPYREAAGSVLSARDVRNFLYLRDSLPFGRQDQFAMAMHGTNFDMIAVETFHGRKPLSKQAVATLRYKKAGGRRLVFAIADIGTAATYSYYWKSWWREGVPLWIKSPYPANPDRYFVQYWNPEWQKVITGDTESYMYGIVRQGYDGVILEGTESFRFFEGTGAEVLTATQ